MFNYLLRFYFSFWYTLPYAGQGVFLHELNMISPKRDRRANFDFIQFFLVVQRYFLRLILF
jgi:hypothetical protein